MIGNTHTIRRIATGLALATTTAALVAPTALAHGKPNYGPPDPWALPYLAASPGPSVTDTLGGNAHAKPAQGYRFITDTLGGNGHAKPVQGYRFITDTLGGNGHPKPVQGYRFITDTLAPGGGPATEAAPSSSSFNWADAAIGAGTAAGALLMLLGGTLLVARRQDRLAV